MKRISLFIATASLFAAQPAQATNGMRMIGFGASQVSMGGASAALPLDAASVVTNPAGLTELGRRVDFGASYFNPTVSYQAVEALPPGYPAGTAVKSTNKFESQRGASPVPAFGLALPIDDHFSFGIGAYGVAGMGVDYFDNLYGGITYSAYSQMRFAPGVAYRVNDLLSLGVTANVMYATVGYDAAEGNFQVAHQAASSFGAGATFGARLTPMKGLAFGAAYETKSWFQDFKFSIPAHQGFNPKTGELFPIAAGQDKLTFNQPSSALAGVAVSPVEPLTLAFDVQWIRWSESNGQNLPAYSGDPNTTGASPWNLNWNDQWVFKVGAQYQVSKLLALRAGYNYGKSPLNPSRAFENIAFPAIAEHHITGGVGLNLTDHFGLNAAVMYAPEVKLVGSNPNPQLIASYQTTMSQVAVDLALAYRF